MENAFKFFSLWCALTNSRQSELLDTFSNSKDYTNLIIHSDDSIVMQLARSMDMNCYNADYYYIDAVFFKPEDLVPEHPKAYYLTDIRIAFEHENIFNSGLFQEVCHLLQVNCDLKVLVAYAPSEEDEKTELDYLHTIIKGSRNEEDLSLNNGFLIIMGNNSLTNWNGWLYKSENWEKLKEKTIM